MTASSSLRPVVLQYLEDHPEAMDSVTKAYLAYHLPHFRLDPRGHNFLNGSRDSACCWCGRTRDQVRHDDLPAGCQNRPELPDIAETLHGEESAAYALMNRAEHDAQKLAAKMGMNGKTLAILHHTYGHHPETVLTDFEFRPWRAEYEAAMEVERERSRAAQKKTVIAVSPTPP
jgi:hypothetical protein